jgi:hypothetical protein
MIVTWDVLSVNSSRSLNCWLDSQIDNTLPTQCEIFMIPLEKSLYSSSVPFPHSMQMYFFISERTTKISQIQMPGMRTFTIAIYAYDMMPRSNRTRNFGRHTITTPHRAVKLAGPCRLEAPIYNLVTEECITSSFIIHNIKAMTYWVFAHWKDFIIIFLWWILKYSERRASTFVCYSACVLHTGRTYICYFSIKFERILKHMNINCYTYELFIT